MQSLGSPTLWIGFIVFVLVVLALDLGIFHRKAHIVGFKESLGWSLVWIALSLTFGAGVYWQFGPQAGLEFVTGYLIEKSLSVDNIFVFVVIFGSLRIPALYQHRVLFWGILSALVLRAGMIFAGTVMLTRFHWLTYIFGGFLVVTGVRLFLARNKEEHVEDSGMLKVLQRVIPSTGKLDGDKFFVRQGGKLAGTPLFLALVLVELSDVVFALDSIPAIFAVTLDPFLVFTSNIFAILGLRSLFFLLAGAVDRFRYLKIGLAAVLVFVGAKMAIVDYVKISSLVSLAVIIGLLGASIVYSLIDARRRDRAEAEAAAAAAARPAL